MTFIKMIIYLIKIFKNLFKAQDARIDFYKMMIKEDESFLNFYYNKVRTKAQGAKSWF